MLLRCSNQGILLTKVNKKKKSTNKNQQIRSSKQNVQGIQKMTTTTQVISLTFDYSFDYSDCS